MASCSFAEGTISKRCATERTSEFSRFAEAAAAPSQQVEGEGAAKQLKVQRFQD
jgi:hypothetical protein